MNIHDLVVGKLAERFPSTDPSFGPLWVAYSAAEGHDYLSGQQLYDHYGGPEDSHGDRAYRFWTDFVP